MAMLREVTNTLPAKKLLEVPARASLTSMTSFGSGSTRASTPRHPEDYELEQNDMDDPRQIYEYVQDVYNNLGREEGQFLPSPDYMDSQPDINAKMRSILVDWLVEVLMKYKLKPETLFLAVNLVDRYLQRRHVARRRLQLIGVTAMLIAAKFEEIYPPEIKDFVYITDNAYSKEDILSMEVSMLSALEFIICVPTAAHFFERYQHINRCSEQHRHLLQYILELTLPDMRMIRYAPSHVAAAATLLSNKLMKVHPSWPDYMVTHTKHTEKMVKCCAKELCGLLEAAEQSPLQAVRRRFSQASLGCVAKMAF